MDVLLLIVGWLGAERYQPHSDSLSSDPLIMMLFVAGDLTIFASLAVMALALITQRRLSIRLSHQAIGLYGGLLLLGAAGHLMDVVVIFVATYRLEVAFTMAQAAFAAVTAVYTAYEVWGRDP